MSSDKYEATFQGGGTIPEIVRAAKAEALREAAAHFLALVRQDNPANYYGAVLWLEDRAAEIETKP